VKAHPRSAFGDAPSGFALSPSRGRHQRPGKAGSAVAPALATRFHVLRVARGVVEEMGNAIE
jgi:hypothetical protein